jgi:mono/diheme cytochrome c family protein
MRMRLCLLLATLSGGVASYALAQDASFEKLQHGKYMVDAGDCIACHTAEHGKPFAGGRPIETPFGTLYSPNITPDRETGIGAWSDNDFYRAMHSGIDRNGKRLYPAFPYPYFTKITRDDVKAMRAYLNTVPAVKSPESVSANNPHRPSDLAWPLNYRVFMRGWDWLFFDEGTYKPDARKSAEWNRGAYLVEGAGHCGACHTPKNKLGGDKDDQPLQGNQIQNWFAPKLANGRRNGLGSWSVDDIVEYLKTGRNKYSGATGLMAEVVANSTSKLNDADLHAIALYVKDLAVEPPPAPAAPKQAQMDAGKAIFADSCSACHQADGDGVPHMFPPLVHNANVQSQDPTSVIRVILEGARTVATDARPTPSSMPAFDWKLSDAEIAAVATYVRNAWGNASPPVDADTVKDLREQLHASTQ